MQNGQQDGTFKRIVNFGDNKEYRVSTSGDVQTRTLPGSQTQKNRIGEDWRDKKVTMQRTDNYGRYYFGTGIKVNGELKNQRVHRLVAENFIRKIEKGEQVNHIDGNRRNNHVSNLEIVTPMQNMANASKRGVFSKALLNGKIKKDDLLGIIFMINSGEKNNVIAKKFNIDPSNISKLRHKNNNLYKEYHHLLKDFKEDHTLRDKNKDIIKLYKQGKTRLYLSKKFKLGMTMVGEIIRSHLKLG